MMKLSEQTGWRELAKYYRTEAMELASYINGKQDRDQYFQKTKQNEKVLASIILPYENNLDFRERAARHKPLADHIGGYIVGSSKLSAAK